MCLQGQTRLRTGGDITLLLDQALRLLQRELLVDKVLGVAERQQLAKLVVLGAAKRSGVGGYPVDSRSPV